MQSPPIRGLKRALTHAAIVRDRRGVTAMAFAVMALTLLAFVGLSTEVGGWFLMRTNLQAAADAAAVAASLAVYQHSDPQAAAEDAMTRNGYDPTSVTASLGSKDPAQAVVDVTVTVPIAPLIAGIFVGTSPINFNVASEAGLVPTGSACVLASAGATTPAQLVISATQVSSCTYVSNGTGNNAIDVSGNPSSTSQAYALVTAGQCNGCLPANSNYMTRPVSTFQPVVVDPYAAALAQVPLPATQCIADPSPITLNTRLVPANGIVGDPTYPLINAPPWYAYCSDVVINSGQVVLTPGVYFFVNAALTINGGQVECLSNFSDPNSLCNVATPQPTGVSLVFSGNPTTPTTVSISSAAEVTLSPPTAADQVPLIGFPNGNNYGILMWRDAAMPPGSVAQPAVNIQTGANGTRHNFLQGLMYFPNAVVSYGGNSNPGNGCPTLLAATILLANQPSNFTTCISQTGPLYTTPQVLAVRILQ